jgi:two-component system sensor histidine kinase UhpB
VLLAAVVVLTLSPATISHPVLLREAVVVLVGVGLMLVINGLLVRRALTPLRRLSALMRRVDLLRPGQRISWEGSAETVELADAFNHMLDRLEAERRESSSRSLLAQEAERQRLAQELHDEIGQGMTAITLQIASIGERAPDELGDELAEARELARAASDDVRRVVRELRPEALDDLGLPAALSALSERFATHSGLQIEERIEAVDGLDPDAELVIYRVAQESLTNVARHSGAARASLTLTAVDGRVRLRIADDGRGLSDPAAVGQGIRGMRERALLVDGSLEIGQPEGLGVEVLLTIPSMG